MPGHPGIFFPAFSCPLPKVMRILFMTKLISLLHRIYDLTFIFIKKISV
jgi:hypothetical protein